MNIDTPRTDAAIEEVSHYDLAGEYRPYNRIDINFARTLERELAAANLKIQELEKDKKVRQKVKKVSDNLEHYDAVNESIFHQVEIRELRTAIDSVIK